jgi:hypothetical protein
MASKQVTKRLLHELRSYEKDPSDALLHLGPINDQELTHWTAILKGSPDTAYQSKLTSQLTLLTHPTNLGSRWPLETQHHNPRHLPQQTSHNNLHHSNLSSKCPFQNWRDMSGSTKI